MTQIDRNRQETEIAKLVEHLKTQYAKIQNSITITRELALSLQTVSKGDEVDEYKVNACVMGQYM